MRKRIMSCLLLVVPGIWLIALTAPKVTAIDLPCVYTVGVQYTTGGTNMISFSLPEGAVAIEVWQDNDSDPSNGGLTCKCFPDPDGSIPTQVTFDAPLETIYYYYVRCEATAGNWVLSNIVSIAQHFGAPVFGQAEPAPNSSVSWTDKPIITVPVSDPIGINAERVAMTLDGAMVAATYNKADGRIVYEPAEPLSSGPHTVEVSVRDIACDYYGNPEGNLASISWTFTKETTPPDPPRVSFYPRINTRTPLFTWNPGNVTEYAVELWHAGVRIWGPIRVTRESAALEDPGVIVEDGQYQLRVWSIDGTGHASETYGSTDFLVDTVKPIFGSPEPAPDSSVGWADKPIIAVPVSDSSGINPESVTMTVDGALITATYSRADGRIICTPVEPLAGGLHTVELSVKDETVDYYGNPEGNLASISWTFTKETQPPEPPQILIPSIINTRTPQFTWKPSGDNTSSIVEYSVELWHADVCIWGPTRVAGQSVTPDSGVIFEDGQYQLRVWAIDGTGHTSETPAAIDFLVDTIRPAPPENVTGRAITNSRTPSFTCDGSSDAGSGVDHLYVELLQLPGTVVQTFNVTGNQIIVPASLTQDGQYEIRIWVDDRAGNRSATCTSYAFTLDTAAPAMTGPIEAAAITNSRRPTFMWPGASDALNGVDHYVVEVWFGGAVTRTITVPAGNGSIIWTLPEECTLSRDGFYTVSVSCFDRAGNSSLGNSTYSQRAVRFSFQLDTVRPVVTLLTPSPGGTYSANEASSLWATASECASAQIRVDGGQWSNVTKLANGTIFHFFDVPLSPGVHTIELRVLDIAGNETITSITITISGQRNGFGFGRLGFPGPGQ